MAEGHTTKPGEASTSAPPAKKSLFLKPTWAKATEDEEAVDFFSRAKTYFPKIVADKERRQKDKAVKLERKRSSASREASTSSRDGKRRRVSHEVANESAHSGESGDDHARGSTHSTTPGSRRSRSSSAQNKNQGSPSSLSQRYKKELEVQKQQLEETTTAKGYISLSDSEDHSDSEKKPIKQSAPDSVTLDHDDSDDSISPIKPKPKLPIEEEEDLQMSDEEFPELVARARARAKQKELELLTAKNTSSNTPEQKPDSENDPIIEIFISSYIVGSKPLVIKRRLSHSLKLVRLSWCDKQRLDGQPLDPSVIANIFLTWRNKRLFDVTTCKGMGLKVDEDGKLYSKGDGIDVNGRVHLEAWTEELFALHQKRLESDRRRLISPLAMEEEEEEEAPEPVEEVRKTKIIVRAKNMPDFKTIVKPSTLVAKVISAYRSKNGLGEDKAAVLYFDGDKLEPDTKCEDMDFDDMDIVEAHVE